MQFGLNSRRSISLKAIRAETGSYMTKRSSEASRHNETADIKVIASYQECIS
jgi:hypothetical protein